MARARGSDPTNAERQRRHRERVKARLAAAEQQAGPVAVPAEAPDLRALVVSVFTRHEDAMPEATADDAIWRLRVALRDFAWEVGCLPRDGMAPEEGAVLALLERIAPVPTHDEVLARKEQERRRLRAARRRQRDASVT